MGDLAKLTIEVGILFIIIQINHQLMEGDKRQTEEDSTRISFP